MLAIAHCSARNHDPNRSLPLQGGNVAKGWKFAVRVACLVGLVTPRKRTPAVLARRTASPPRIRIRLTLSCSHSSKDSCDRRPGR